MPPTSRIRRRLRRLRRRIVIRTAIILEVLRPLLRAAVLRPPPRLGIKTTPFFVDQTWIGQLKDQIEVALYPPITIGKTNLNPSSPQLET